MHHDALRLLILSKLADGRLPLNRMSKVWAGPGHGESCDACNSIVTKGEFVIDATPLALAVSQRPLQLHARCFWIWETERRPQMASDDVATAPVMAPCPGRRASPSISGQMNGYGVMRGYDEE